MSWSNLKTDYTDAAWVGNKKYKITNTDNSTSFNAEIQDNTVYTNEQDSFYGAADANATNDAINNIMANGGVYTAGDTFTLSNVAIQGGMFNSNKSARFIVTVAGVIPAGVSPSITAFSGLVATVDGTLLEGATQDWQNYSGTSVSVSKVAPNTLDVRINRSAGFVNGTNYTPLVFWGTLTIAFS